MKMEHAEFVEVGLRYGFSIGVVKGSLKGRRVFSNYPTAYAARESVSAAITSRVEAKKTICLGPWLKVKDELYAVLRDFFIFPMGAVPKPHQPEVMRPTSDHTRTGFNSLVSLVGILKYSLDTYNEISWFLKKDYFMRVSDVADAFLLIPLAPWLWPFFLFRWFESSSATEESVFCHLFGDFGTKGLPGTFKVFLVDVVIQMARSELVLTLPLPVYVDDTGLIGPEEDLTNDEMAAFQVWSEKVCGVPWKVLKDRHAAQLQFMIGFWWDSRDFSRCLEAERRASYLSVFKHAASARKLTLRDRQRVAGRGQRAVMTFPPGASCLLTTCFLQMRGLKLLWHASRTTRAERIDYQFIHDLLELNLGRGYYSYEGFKQAPTILSDASDSRKYSGGGWVSACGRYDWYIYHGRQPIDFKEGDTVLRACDEMGPLWSGCVVPFGIDNSVIERSVAKGRSGVERLNELMKHLFVAQVRHNFVLAPFWISTTDNFLADHLSRGRELAFLESLHDGDFLLAAARPVHRLPGAGRVVAFDRPSSMAALRQLLDSYTSNNLKDGPSRGAGVGGDAQLLSIRYTPTSIFSGLPMEYHAQLETVLDNRLAPSSRAHVDSAMKRWSTFCGVQEWDPLLDDADEARGGKLTAWVLSMVNDTELVFRSIVNYVWGMRTWHTLQGKQDPVMGCSFWRELMRGVAVLTAVPGEPRQQVPLDVLRDMLAVLSASDAFEDVQLHLVLLVLLFTFSRTECPCPKAWTGANVFDPDQHWQVRDFRLAPGPSGSGWVLWVRFKRIKQDPRVERPSMSHADVFMPSELAEEAGFGNDWVPIGDLAGEPLFSVACSYKRFVKAVGRQRERDESMFLARDAIRCYTYSCLLTDFKRVCRQVGCEMQLGPHGLRVLGYNLSKSGNGVDLTVAHGGWMSEAHSRYERFTQQQVLGVPAGMLGAASQFAGDRPISRARAKRGGSGRLTVGEQVLAEGLLVSSDDEVDESGVSEPAPLVPPGYERQDYTQPSGRAAFVVVAPDGTRCRTMAESWRHYASRERVPPPGQSPAGRASPASAGRRSVRRHESPRVRSSQRAVFADDVGSPALAAAEVAQVAPEGPIPVSLQGVDLTAAVVEFDRPSARRAPAARQAA